ncbi:MAG: aldehyde ferredoxin oxidoreductase family protein [Dehalococcoidia bacterium]|nr:aldehyde ferredoxin oxidoreductase family protein [Dehalococcoidia bacterium]
MISGYGKILEVDLTTRQLAFQEVDNDLARKYIGGVGLAARLLWDETSANTEAFSPGNPLVFMTGPLTGLIPSSSRHSVCAISPLTGIWGEAHAGGDWAGELRHAGFTGIVVRGKAEMPVYLWLHDGNAEIRDARHLWGKDTCEVDTSIKKETDAKASISSIGIAGEKLVRIACIMNDGEKGRAAARCGLGAVMGSKNLKAIAVRGTQALPVANKQGLRESIARIYAQSPVKKPDETIEVEIERLKSFLRLGNVPVKNYLEGTFEPGYKLADGLRETMPLYCRTCPYFDMESKLTRDGRRHMVWEHWGPLGAQCLIGDADALQEAYLLCNRYGLDTISTGGVISFAMECYDKALIDEHDTGGLRLSWGNAEAMLELVKQIGEKRGIGELLGEGVKLAAERIGGLAREYALHVKGLELPSHDARASNYLAVMYATGSFGASHMDGITVGRVGYEKGQTGTPQDQESARTARFRIEGTAEAVVRAQDLMSVVNSLVVCCKLLSWRTVRPDHLLELLNCITGWDMSLEEFNRVGERIFNLKRMFNVRRGISRKDDNLPPRILTHKRGSGGAAENLPNLGVMLNEYYRVRQWSEEGIPLSEKLTELGLGECVPPGIRGRRR